MLAQKSEITVDLVIPVFNESGVVEQTYSKICEFIHGLSYKFNIFFVDDGSSDGTAESLATLARAAKNITVLTLARNFGHQAALTAGLDARALISLFPWMRMGSILRVDPADDRAIYTGLRYYPGATN